jgi:hypothetical protein
MWYFSQTIILLLLSSLVSEAQIFYSWRMQAGYQYYLFRGLPVNPGPGWIGYNLKEKQNGFNLTTSKGIAFGFPLFLFIRELHLRKQK